MRVLEGLPPLSLSLSIYLFMVICRWWFVVSRQSHKVDLVFFFIVGLLITHKVQLHRTLLGVCGESNYVWIDVRALVAFSFCGWLCGGWIVGLREKWCGRLVNMFVRSVVLSFTNFQVGLLVCIINIINSILNSESHSNLMSVNRILSIIELEKFKWRSRDWLDHYFLKQMPW